MASGSTILPSPDMQALSSAEEVLSSGHEVILTDGTASAPLPAELRTLLADIVRAMRRGQAVTVDALSQQLTTQQAADLLGVSRPTLIKLLEAGAMPYETPGRHRRLRLSDVLTYQQTRRGTQRQAMKELAADAQDAGLYDLAPESFEAALADARRSRA